MANLQTHRELQQVLQDRLVALLDRDEMELRVRGLLVERDLIVYNLRKQLDFHASVISELECAEIITNEKENWNV